METSICSDITFLPFTYDYLFHGLVEKNPFLHKMPYRSLGRTGLKISTLSFHGEEMTQESVGTVRNALRNGVNYIDTSPFYENSETLIRQGLQGVPRSAFYIGTKVGRNFRADNRFDFDFTTNAVLKSVENSLNSLGLNYVDVIQIQDVEFCLDLEILMKQTLPALESVVRAGKAKFIGITGYDLKVMKKIVESSPVKIDTIMSHCHYNFHDTSILDYVSYFESKNIGIINASPLAGGLYTAKGSGTQQWYPEINNAIQLAKKHLVSHHGETMMDAALGFSLHPKPLSIATTLVNIPNDDFLIHNLNVLTTTRTEQDNKLYSELLALFEKNVECGNNLQRVELVEYKKKIGLIKSIPPPEIVQPQLKSLPQPQPLVVRPQTVLKPVLKSGLSLGY